MGISLQSDKSISWSSISIHRLSLIAGEEKANWRFSIDADDAGNTSQVKASGSLQGGNFVSTGKWVVFVKENRPETMLAQRASLSGVNVEFKVECVISGGKDNPE